MVFFINFYILGAWNAGNPVCYPAATESPVNVC